MAVSKERREAVARMWAKHQHLRICDIAEKLGLTGFQVRADLVVLRTKGDPRAKPRKAHLKLSYLSEEARRRNMTTLELQRHLLRTIERDRLVNAVLDDEVAS